MSDTPNLLRALLCRLTGGHEDGRGMVNNGYTVVWSRVCQRCDRYLGRTPVPDPALQLCPLSGQHQKYEALLAGGSE